MQLASSPLRCRVRWVVAAASFLALVLTSLEAYGRSSRRSFDPPPEFHGRRWAMVGDAADAVRVWSAARLRGRRALILTGRWSRPRNLRDEPVTGEETAAALASGKPLDYLDANAAMFVAASQGLVRALDVLMPPPAFERRLAQVAGTRGLVRERDSFLLPFEAMERRFAVPSGYRGHPETVLLLVEPSFFDEGAPADLPGWLEARRVRFDLALIALDDPAASDEQRGRARALAESLGAAFVEVDE